MHVLSFFAFVVLVVSMGVFALNSIMPLVLKPPKRKRTYYSRVASVRGR